MKESIIKFLKFIYSLLPKPIRLKDLKGPNTAPAPKKESKFNIIPPQGLFVFRFGETFVIAGTQRGARRIMGRKYEEYLKEKAIADEARKKYLQDAKEVK